MILLKIEREREKGGWKGSCGIPAKDLSLTAFRSMFTHAPGYFIDVFVI